jgi:hypothetical protein
MLMRRGDRGGGREVCGGFSRWDDDDDDDDFGEFFFARNMDIESTVQYSI